MGRSFSDLTEAGFLVYRELIGFYRVFNGFIGNFGGTQSFGPSSASEDCG